MLFHSSFLHCLTPYKTFLDRSKDVVLLLLVDSTLISLYFVVLCLISFLNFLSSHWLPPSFHFISSFQPIIMFLLYVFPFNQGINMSKVCV